LGLFSKSYKLIAVFFNLLSPLPYLSTAAYEFSIVQSSAAGHQLTPCSAGPLFLISPHRQTENEFLSTHFSVWGTGKSHRGLNPVNGGGVGLSTGMHISAKNCFTARAL
jgi:hypothetical protein